MAKVIYDIEASCENKEINNQYPMETIEIGAVKLNSKNEIIEKFQIFIKPTKVNTLTKYCTDLTGIKFSDLKDAKEFPEAIKEFYEFIKGSKTWSCGNFDKNFLSREIDNRSKEISNGELIKDYIVSSHGNLKRIYSQVTHNKQSGMLIMAEYLGIEMTGTLHRGLDDSINLVKIFIELDKIREKELLKVFKGQKLLNVIESIDKGLEYKDGIIIDSANNKTYTFLEFIDKFCDIIIRDFKNRSVNGLDRRDIKKLRNFAITF